MLNGKFFTGLPPKMIDRGGAATNRNRLESHFFWPDDTKVDTAVECRVKRRNSVLEKSNERPIYEKQLSVADNEVDTKKRFSKEFSQSSIQFYDNLNDNRNNSRVSMQRNSACRKMQIAEKPTNTKLELPGSVVDEAYTAEKKKQAYTSKIQFNDYMNDEGKEPQSHRNNLRKPKMDMNDKREMELNSKNSPKLQVKRDVRSLSEEKEQRKINNREVRNEKRPMKDNFIESERVRILNNEERHLLDRRSVQPRLNKSPQRCVVKPRNDYRERFTSEREIFREPKKSQSYKYDEENLYFERENRPVLPEPKIILQNNIRDCFEPQEERDYYASEQDIQNKLRAVHLKSPTRRQYYPPVEYYNYEPDTYYDQSDQIFAPINRREYNENDLIENFNDAQRFERDSRANTTINRINNHIKKQVTTSETPSTPEVELKGAVKPRKHLRSSLCFNDGAIVAANSNNNDNDNDKTRSPTSSQYPQKRNARSSATQRVSVGLPD